jgi:pimeloyl-ACP methyl ester carboxylesterase
VTVLRRPHGLVAPASTRAAGVGVDGRQVGTIDVADDYADAIRSELGAVDLLALSTGGLIGQHVALHHPDLVSRLALVVAGNRLAEPGRSMCHRWLRLHRQERWGTLRGELAAAAVDGAAAQWVARRLGGSDRSPDPTDAADFATTVAADLEHDTTGALGGVKAPTLVVGGRDDPFFPEDVLRATAAEIPGATLAVHDGGHGLPKHHARWLQDQLVGFLARSRSGEHGRLAPPPGGGPTDREEQS